VYIVAIGWLYVVIMMAATEKSFLSGAVTLLCYGILPLGLSCGSRARPSAGAGPRHADAADEKPDQHD